jgi:hypothetical protein
MSSGGTGQDAATNDRQQIGAASNRRQIGGRTIIRQAAIAAGPCRFEGLAGPAPWRRVLADLPKGTMSGISLSRQARVAVFGDLERRLRRSIFD